MPATREKIVYPKLSYTITGTLFEVHNKLGNSHKEKYYQRGVEELLKSRGLNFDRELKADLYINDKRIGYYSIDFVVENKIVLELKAKPKLHPNDFRQVMSYLKTHNLKLGLLVNFRLVRLKIYRVLNPEVDV